MQICSQSEFLVPQVNTVYFGQTQLIWNSLLLTLRNVGSFSEFKFLIKNWKPANYPCRLCKNNIPNIGFVNVSH